MSLLANDDYLPIKIQNKLYETITKLWQEIFNDTIPPSKNNFSVNCLKRSGATSKSYLISAIDSKGITQRFFVKQYRFDDKSNNFCIKNIRRDYEVARTLAPILSKSMWLKVPEAYAFLPKENIIVSFYIQGNDLSYLFNRKLKYPIWLCQPRIELEKLVYNIGRGLVQLQSIPIKKFDECLVVSSNSSCYFSYINQFEEAAFFLKKKRIFPDLIKQCQHFFENVLCKYFVGEPIRCFEQGDFILQNFILDKNGDLYIFDFPSASIGSAYRDAAEFVLALEDLTYLRIISKNRVKSLIKSFLRTWTASLANFDQKVLNAFMILIQFRSIMIIFLAKGAKSQNFLKRIFYEKPLQQFEKKINNILDS